MQVSARRLFSLRVPKKSRASRIVLHPSRENDPFIPPFPPAEAKVREERERSTEKSFFDVLLGAGRRSAVLCALHHRGRATALPCSRGHDGE